LRREKYLAFPSSLPTLKILRSINFKAMKDVNIKLFSASRENIQNMDGNFWAIYVRIMHANFKVSSFTDVGGEWGDEQMAKGCKAFLNRSLYKISKLPFRFRRDNIFSWKPGQKIVP